MFVIHRLSSVQKYDEFYSTSFGMAARHWDWDILFSAILLCLFSFHDGRRPDWTLGQTGRSFRSSGLFIYLFIFIYRRAWAGRIRTSMYGRDHRTDGGLAGLLETTSVSILP